MRSRKSIVKPCLESFLSKKECAVLVKDNHMKDIKTFCNRDGIATSLFILKNTSLQDIYATEKDWSIFKDKMATLTDPSANALSHYLNSKNDRITTNSVFFTDTTSGVSLLNPRFTYLVNKSNDPLSKSFPDIHISLSVTSTPVTAAEIENYYTEGTITISFFLNISYNSKGVQVANRVKIIPDKESFLETLKKVLLERSFDNTGDNNKDNSNIKKDVMQDSIKFYTKRYDLIQDTLKELDPYLDKIDDLIIPRKVMNKTLLEKVKAVIPESLYSLVYSLLKDGSLKSDTVNVSISNKAIVGKSLREELEKRSAFYKDQADTLSSKSGVHSLDKTTTNNDFTSYVDAVQQRLSDIYTFVTNNPLNSKGTIPSKILTQYRNKNAIIFVLSPVADPSHRCMYIASAGEDVRDLKYTFNSAGTESNSYSVNNGHVTVS